MSAQRKTDLSLALARLGSVQTTDEVIMHKEKAGRNSPSHLRPITAVDMDAVAMELMLRDGEQAPRSKDFRDVLRFVRERYAEHDRLGIRPSPYFIDWVPMFTPIESAAWGAIRHYGIPMLPQYPIGPFFADFADPDTKVVIECDGKQFHQDKERDASRDRFMADKGWTVFRVTGRECMAPEIDWEEISYLIADDERDAAERLTENWMLHSVEGVVAAIGVRFYSTRITKIDHKFIAETLRRHCAAKGGE